ncbi:MAG: alpha/beta hydrolase, partial [Dermatophilaceae bacterium]
MPALGPVAAAVGAAGAAASSAASSALSSAVSSVGEQVRRRGGYRSIDAPDGWAHTPTEAFTVEADDGVVLHVEIDAPEPDARQRPKLADRPPTVVLVHGFALTAHSWVLQRRALRHSGFRVVTYDQRGHGRSGRP